MVDCVGQRRWFGARSRCQFGDDHLDFKEAVSRQI
jgi:hypothetical protein